MRRVRALIACLLAAPGIGARAETLPDSALTATLWMQAAAEYAAVAQQTYAAARRALSDALADPSWSGALENSADNLGMPPAVILDLDETVLDNSPFQASLVMADAPFDAPAWDRWLSLAAAQALPGAVELVRAARALGVAVFYVTNRACVRREAAGDPCPQQAETMANLEALGLGPVDDAHLLLRGEVPGWRAEKRSRRAAIARTHRILLLIGDDLGDFVPGVKLPRDERRGPEQVAVLREYRRLVQAAFSDWWGTRWFVLPNPVYGSWLDVLGDEPAQALRPSAAVVKALRQRQPEQDLRVQ